MTGVDALVLAAGRSTRIAGIAGGQPKPLIPVAGEPIVGHTLRWLAGYGVRNVWVNLHHLGDAVRAALGDGSRWGVRITYSDEPVILGTAGAARRLVDQLSEEFLVVYGDNLVRFDLDDLLKEHRRRRAGVTIAVFDDHVPNTGIAGGRVQLDAGGAVTAFVEGDRPSGGSMPYVNAGVYVVRGDLLRRFPADVFLDWGKDVFPRLLADRAPVWGYPIGGYCLGLDTPESYERGLALITSGQVKLA